MDIQKLKNTFLERYGSTSEKIGVYFAPGRVNLIGEHTDYNGGYVLPCALSFGTYLLIRKTQDERLHFSSLNFDFSCQIELSKADEKIGAEWVNFPLGIIDQLAQNGHKISGLEFMYFGDIPNEAGLSSSASIEVVTVFALNAIFGFGLTKWDMIDLAQKCEHDFIGVKCGIMDQFAVTMGRMDHALFLNCLTLEYETVPIILGDYRFLIINSNKSRDLASSKYNERVGECAEAVQNINKELNIEYLGQLDLNTFREVEHLIQNPVNKKRTFHVVNENYRVKESVSALREKDLKRFGTLMNASHKSLRDDYEVTGKELDTLVELAWACEGVIGARMTGAGFGGCTVNLVHKDFLEPTIESIKLNYRQLTGLEPLFYQTDIGDGVREI
jgi:galactokinase